MAEEHTTLEEQALDIVMGGDLTEQQLDALMGDDELQECVQDALDMRTAVQRSKDHVDVEARLKAFREGHESATPATKVEQDSTQPNRRRLGIWSALVAAAAVFIGALVFIYSANSRQEPQHLYSAANAQNGISLTTTNGDKVTLSPSSKQTSTVTLDDFRRVFADDDRVQKVTLTVPIGKAADIVLPDSSHVSLSPGSSLTFPTEFGERHVVQLKGYGYFKVRHDASRPFTVLTGKTETTVLGTEFAVDSKAQNVTLITGRVSVHTEGQGRGTVLKPSQQACFANGGMMVSEVDTKPYTMWRDGYLYFDNVELKDIMTAIAENYNKTIDFRSSRALHYRMRFMTERNAGINEALRLMNAMEKVHVSLHGNTIVVEDI